MQSKLVIPHKFPHFQNTITDEERRGSGYDTEKSTASDQGHGIKSSETKKRGIYLGGGHLKGGGLGSKHPYYYPSGWYEWRINLQESHKKKRVGLMYRLRGKRDGKP